MYRIISHLTLLPIWLLAITFSNTAAASIFKYQVTDRNGFVITQQELYIQVNESSLKKFYPSANMLEIWEVGRNETLSKTRYFIEDKKAVYYSFSDLRLLGEASYWHQLDPLFDIRIRNFFTNIDWVDAEYEKYSGLVGNIHIEMQQKVDSYLPNKLVFKQGARYTQYELVEAQNVTVFNHKRQGYELYDFADLSDMLHDPFVIKSFEQGLLERRDISVNHADNQYMIHWH